MKIIDLSIPIDEKTPVYPGDPKQEINHISTVEKEGWNEHRLTFNTHFSTHIDAPWHMIKDGKKLSEYPLDRFIGEGVLIDVRKGFDIKFLDKAKVTKGSIVLLWTDHCKNLYKNYFEGAKFMPADFAKKLAKLKPKMVGMDIFSPDGPPFEIHKILLGADVLLIENMRNFDKLKGKFKVFALPINLQNTDGAQCRAIAIL